MKKLICALISVALVCSLCTIAFADATSTEKSIPDTSALDSGVAGRNIPDAYSLSAIDLDVITSDLTYMVVDPTKYSKIEVGNYIPAHVWDGSNLASSDEEILFFPIYGDNKIVAILTMFDPLGSKSYTVGVDYAAELNSAIAKGAQDFFIVEAGSKVFLCSDGKASLLKQYGEPEDVDAEALKTYTDGKTKGATKGSSGKPVPEVEPAPVATPGIASDYDASNSLSASALNSLISNGANSFECFSESSAGKTKNATAYRLDITPVSSRQARSIRYLPIGTANQGSTERCTFYATSLIGNFLSNNYYTPQDLVDEMGQEMGNIDDANYLLWYLYDQDYSFVDDIYGKDAGMFIEEGWPLYAAFYDENWDKGHALAVCGYDDAGNSGIYVSETLTGSYKAIYPNSRSEYITRAYSRNCYWSQTLYYQYW